MQGQSLEADSALGRGSHERCLVGTLRQLGIALELDQYPRAPVMEARTGPLDYPGTSWRDRPAIDRGDGVFLAGDMVAAPGLLSEVSWAGAIEASSLALEATARPQLRRVA